MSDVNPVASVIKTETINDDDSVDCFGNFDAREKKTCGICGMNGECSITTAKILSDKKFEYRPHFKSSINTSHKLLKEAPDVVELVAKIKTKQKIVEKKMKVKKKIKSESSEVSDKSVKKIKKLVKKEGKEEKPGRKAKESIEVIEGTTLPVGFKTLHKAMKKMGEVLGKTSVTNVRGENGIIFCVPVVGRTKEKVELFLNRSSGYEGIKSGKYTEVKPSKKGELLLVVQATEKSQSEALEQLEKWSKDLTKHVAAHSGKRGPKGEGKIKKVKKSEKEDSSGEGKKVIKKKLKSKDEVKPEKSEKKGPPVIKPSKKKEVSVDDEEG